MLTVTWVWNTGETGDINTTRCRWPVGQIKSFDDQKLESGNHKSQITYQEIEKWKNSKIEKTEETQW